MAARKPHKLHSELDNTKTHLVHPWPNAKSMGDEVRGMIHSGEGIYVKDDHGRTLIDGPAGMWCTNVGHRNKTLANALRDQALELSYNSPWYSCNEPAAELSRRLAKHAPGDLEHVFFTTGGSTAVESALRFVQFYNNVRGRTAKKKIICREGGYHGSTYLSSTLNGSQRTRDWMDYADDLIIKISNPNPFRRPMGQSIADFCNDLVLEFKNVISDMGPEHIGAFIGEPVLASGGVIVPPPGYFKRIRALCAEHEILFIADEVVTAFGRLGHMFASQDVFGVEPDIITFAKGVTSGYFPLGGMIVSAQLLDNLRDSNHPDAMYAHGFTYSGHPIGCAVALKNLDILEDGILEHTRNIAPYFQDQLAGLMDLPLVGDVRGMGLMACIECVGDRESLNPIRLDTEVGERIDRHSQALGLLLRPLIHMCVMSPPLIINHNQIDKMTSILREAISRTMSDIRAEGIWNG